MNDHKSNYNYSIVKMLFSSLPASAAVLLAVSAVLNVQHAGTAQALVLCMQ